jgi:hypothetical protein
VQKILLDDGLQSKAQGPSPVEMVPTIPFVEPSITVTVELARLAQKILLLVELYTKE